MRFYEATEKDAAKLLPFIKRELEVAGFKPKATVEDLERRLSGRWRYVYGMDEGGNIQALLSVHPIQIADKGLAYEVKLFLVSSAHLDKMLGFDELCLFGCNILTSEGVHHIFGHVPLDPTRYAQNLLKLDAADEGTPGVIAVSGDPQEIIANILQRRPEWRISL